MDFNLENALKGMVDVAEGYTGGIIQGSLLQKELDREYEKMQMDKKVAQMEIDKGYATIEHDRQVLDLTRELNQAQIRESLAKAESEELNKKLIESSLVDVDIPGTGGQNVNLPATVWLDYQQALKTAEISAASANIKPGTVRYNGYITLFGQLYGQALINNSYQPLTSKQFMSVINRAIAASSAMDVTDTGEPNVQKTVRKTGILTKAQPTSSWLDQMFPQGDTGNAGR